MLPLEHPALSTDLPNEDVLFAVYAVQLGFCTPAQVATAAAAAANDPQRSIADLLEQEAAINVAGRRAIERRLAKEVRDSCETLASPSPSKEVLPPRLSPECTEAPTVNISGKPDATVADPPSIDPGLEAEVDERVLPAQPGRYTIMGQHAAGGQARILLAIDEHIGREVAIKELIPGAGSGEWSTDTPSSMRSAPGEVRFLREARVTGQLEHPNIVPVHEVGRREDGTFYYSMRFVRGDTLAKKLKECKTLADRLKLLGAFWDVCNAIAFAHSRGVVHRDIKPENIMAGEFGETVVLDWGVAKVAGKQDIRATDIEKELRFLRQADTGKTAAGTAIGTPSYMSPEQARGQIDQIDERSAVWGLGAVLYELLTGQPPYKGETPMDTMLMVGEDPLVPVRERCPDAPPELAAVAEKALSRKRSDRYGSAKELTQEIDVYMTGGRVRAYEYSSWELLKRFAAQNKTAIAAVGLILVIIISALVSVTLSLKAETQAREAEHSALENAEAARAQEQVERRMAHFHLAQAYAEKADRLLADLRLASAQVLAAASLVHNPAHPKSPYHEQGFLRRQPASRDLWVAAASQIFKLQFGTQARLERALPAGEVLTRVAFSRDGRHLAAGSFDHKVYLWDLAAAQPHFQTLDEHTDEVYGVAYSPDGRWLATSDRKGTVLVRQAATGKVHRRLKGHRAMVHQVAFSPDSRTLATAAWDGTSRLWDVRSGRPQGVLEHSVDKIYGLAFAPDGRTLATACSDERVRLWDLKRAKLIREFTGNTDEVYAVAFSPDGRLLASAGNDRLVHLWRVADGQDVARLAGHTDGILSLAFAPDGRRLASASYDRTVRLWDLSKRPDGQRARALVTIDGHSEFVFGTAFSADGLTLATAGWDRTARLWSLTPGRDLPELAGHAGTVYAVAFSTDGAWLASGSWDRTVRVWQLKPTPRVRHVLRGHTDIVDNLAISPDSKRLVSASRDKTARVWDLATGRQLYVIRGHHDKVTAAVFSPDGKTLATCGADHKIRLWDAASGRARRVLVGHQDDINNLRFSPDGTKLASVSNDRTACLWDVRSGERLRVFKGHEDWVSGVDFSPDGTRLATSGKDGTIRIWNVATGQASLRLTGHDQWVNAVTFSPNGRLLASASDDRTIRLWSAADGLPLLTLNASLEAVAIAFSPDGERLAAGDGNLVRLYPLDFAVLNADPNRLLQDASRAAGMRLDGFDLQVTNDEVR